MQVGDLVECQTLNGKLVGLIVRFENWPTAVCFDGQDVIWVLLGGREALFFKENLEVIGGSG